MRCRESSFLTLMEHRNIFAIVKVRRLSVRNILTTRVAALLRYNSISVRCKCLFTQEQASIRLSKSCRLQRFRPAIFSIQLFPRFHMHSILDPPANGSGIFNDGAIAVLITLKVYATREAANERVLWLLEKVVCFQ